MKEFMNEDFLLETETAKTLYHDYAKNMPILDYHCHINPQEIAQNKTFSDLAEPWLGGDHYKWRLIRANGTAEKYITGKDCDPYDKFVEFACALPKAIGNPLYNWAHLELKRFFDINTVLNSKTAKEIWDTCNAKLQAGFSAKDMITMSNVAALCTTDDPVDSLEWHKVIAEDDGFKTKVLPAMRPDKVLNIDKNGFKEYIKTLSASENVEIKSIDDLYIALNHSMDRFDKAGCKVSDHGIDYIPFKKDTTNSLNTIFTKALNGETLSLDEVEIYKTEVLIFLGKEYAKREWAMQIHYGAVRNNNTRMFNELGPDTGYDSVGEFSSVAGISGLLNELDSTNQLPKTILYSLNPNDNAALVTLAYCFPGEGIVSKVQHGSAWWFNDTKQGMEAQLQDLASRGLLGGFLGMLTDSRSFLSYVRHEYFRRILCNYLGKLIENGEYPNDIQFVGQMVQDICYNNAANYFNIK